MPKKTLVAIAGMVVTLIGVVVVPAIGPVGLAFTAVGLLLTFASMVMST